MNIHFSILLLLPILILPACTQSEAKAKDEQDTTRPKIVRTAPAKALQYEEEVHATGQLGLSEQSQLSFKTGGIIRRVLVEEGQEVRGGQLLAELDLDEIEAQTAQASLGSQQASIQVDNAKLALRLAKRDYENAQGLYQDSVATLEQLQNAEVQLDNARNQLAAAEKGVQVRKEQAKVADYNLRFSRIVAPANGTILRRMAEPNELVGAGRPILLFGSREEAWVVTVNVPDKDVIFLDIGDKALVSFDAYPGHSFPGVVRMVASMADPMTSTYAVEVELTKPDKKLLSGFIGRVDIQTGSIQRVVAIPVDALLAADRRQGRVYVTEDGKATKRPVQIYRFQGDQLLISDGLQGDERVIVSGVGYLQDGDSIITKAQ